MSYLGWIGNLVLIAGMASMSPKRRWPFALLVIGEAIWTVHAIRRGSFDMATICVVFVSLALVNFLKWRRES